MDISELLTASDDMKNPAIYSQMAPAWRIMCCAAQGDIVQVPSAAIHSLDMKIDRSSSGGRAGGILPHVGLSPRSVTTRSVLFLLLKVTVAGLRA